MRKHNREFVFLILCFLSFSCSADSDIESLLQKYDERFLVLERIISEQNTEIAALKSLVERQGKQEQKIKQLENKSEPDVDKNNSNPVQTFGEMERNGSKNLNHKVRRLLLPSTPPSVAVKAEVAFFAERRTVLANMGNYQPIVYDQVKVNHGGAYSEVDGEFLAPYGGVYVFSWTSSNGDNTHMVTEMVINGKRYAHTWTDSGNHADYSVASVTCVAELKKGDRVWIRSSTLHSRTLTCTDNSMCSFTGFLLY